MIDSRFLKSLLNSKIIFLNVYYIFIVYINQSLNRRRIIRFNENISYLKYLSIWLFGYNLLMNDIIEKLYLNSWTYFYMIDSKT